ncbi:hypothetical protein HF086_006869 [Spodoptera exigua]|uniref:Uncharacterized protein n=1 Tax=Spodoptera exigua TaxID=7107 RepID=A0A922MM76_SPOEX|nr:hypothetical protein HF086_006869 [Spodoptera exigua]
MGLATGKRLAKVCRQRECGSHVSLGKKSELYLEEFGFLHLQGTKPIRLTHQPVRLPAYFDFVGFIKTHRDYKTRNSNLWIKKLRIALQDSPVGLASYILDRVMIFTDPANKLDLDGGMQKYYNYDQLLDNIMLYWISGSITTSMRIYKEIFEDSDMEKIIERIPTSGANMGRSIQERSGVFSRSEVY